MGRPPPPSSLCQAQAQAGGVWGEGEAGEEKVQEGGELNIQEEREEKKGSSTLSLQLRSAGSETGGRWADMSAGGALALCNVNIQRNVDNL